MNDRQWLLLAVALSVAHAILGVVGEFLGFSGALFLLAAVAAAASIGICLGGLWEVHSTSR